MRVRVWSIWIDATLVPVPTKTSRCHSDIKGRRPFDVPAVFYLFGFDCHGMGPSREPLHRLFEFCMVLAICLCEPWTLRYSIWTWWHFTWCYLFAACLGLADWLYLKLFEQVSGRDPYYRYLFINLAMYIAEDSLGALFQFGSNLEGFSSHRITQMIQFLSSVCVCV